MFEYVVLGAVAGIALLFWVRHRLIVIAQPLRLELADKGEALLQHQGLPKSLRPFIQNTLDTAFGNGSTLFFGLFYVPMLAALTVVRQRTLVRMFGMFEFDNAEAKALYGEVMRLHRRITFANHPLLSTLLTLEIELLFSIALVLRGLLRGSITVSPNKVADQNAILDVIETRKPLFRAIRI